MKVDIDKRYMRPELFGREHLYNELISWLRSKELSVSHAKALLISTAGFIDNAWLTEAERTKV